MLKRKIYLIKALRQYYAKRNSNPLAEGLLKKAKETVDGWEDTLTLELGDFLEHLVQRIEEAERENSTEALRALQTAHEFKREQHANLLAEYKTMTERAEQAEREVGRLTKSLQQSETLRYRQEGTLRRALEFLPNGNLIDMIISPF